MTKCLICDNKIGFFENKMETFSEHYIYQKCVEEAGIPFQYHKTRFESQPVKDKIIKDYFSKGKGIKQLFTVTDSVDMYT